MNLKISEVFMLNIRKVVLRESCRNQVPLKPRRNAAECLRSGMKPLDDQDANLQNLEASMNARLLYVKVSSL